ncbi:MAG: hypothetical protein Tsb009_04440 [Planctomycetaceae bacterium]
MMPPKQKKPTTNAIAGCRHVPVFRSLTHEYPASHIVADTVPGTGVSRCATYVKRGWPVGPSGGLFFPSHEGPDPFNK